MFGIETGLKLANGASFGSRHGFEQGKDPESGAAYSLPVQDDGEVIQKQFALGELFLNYLPRHSLSAFGSEAWALSLRLEEKSAAGGRSG